MSTIMFSVPLTTEMSKEELIDLYAKNLKELNWAFGGNIDFKNIKVEGITAKNIKALNITTDKLAALSVITEKLAVGAVTAEKITVAELSAITADLGHITAGLIEAITIYGSYIATANGTYPRAEMSSADNLFAAYSTANESIKISPVYSGSPSLLFYDGGAVKANVAVPSGSDLSITTSGSTGMHFQSADELNLDPSGSLKINGLQGYTGSFNAIYSIDFVGGLWYYRTITVNKGIITGVS